MKYFCCDHLRLEVIKLRSTANGIEFLDVRDHLEPVQSLRQRTIFVRLLQPGFNLTPDNVRIEGGERIATVAVEWVAAADDLPAGTDPALVDGIDDLPRTLVIRTAMPGDGSRYTLHLRAGSASDQPPADFDPRLSDIEFSFKVECSAGFDCATATPCPPEAKARPDIDYLAKDYTGFRRLMLDRLSLLVPGWKERSAADLGITLVELLAYAADQLSYRQDAVANEAYLATARRRISVRRHARLVDYALHDGCNARVWIHLSVAVDHHLSKGALLLTRGTNPSPELAPDSQAARDAIAAGSVVFQTGHDADLSPDLNALSFYTWGDFDCCVPRGATSATLRGLHPQLRVNDVLIFQEMFSPTTFNALDADRGRRWAVRLISVRAGADPYGGLFEKPPTNAQIPITEIAWDAADALPFPFCLSVKEKPDLEISIALGNIVLADHGQTESDEALGNVPAPHLKRPLPASGAKSCEHREAELIPIRFRPVLSKPPLTQGFDLAADLAPLPDEEGWKPASTLLRRDPHDAQPQISAVTGKKDNVFSSWAARSDLLASSSDDNHFVVETENDGSAVLRFGDDAHGRRPSPETSLTATYRFGNGTAGNIGADSDFHVVTAFSGVFSSVTNPLPATGGIDPEDVESARRDAPEAFRTQQRAVTEGDYAFFAEQRPDVQRAAATFRWTGSWYTAFVTADRLGGVPVDARFEHALRQNLERYRVAGYDLEIDSPRNVALDVSLHVCAKAGYFRSEVLRAVGAELGTGVLPDGRLALFHPDNFSFGEPVYLSRIIATAQAVEGVEAVWATKFQRLESPDSSSLETGVIPIGRLEIAQLASTPNFPERGLLTLEPGGGR